MVKLYWENYDKVKDELSEIEKDWLFNEESLTNRLTFLSQNNFSLEVLSEGKQILREDEVLFLENNCSKSEWVREVILKGNNQPWVYARSIIVHIPNKQLGNSSLMNIGDKPLGSALFTDHSFKRSSLDITTYPKTILPMQYRFSNLWARRSKFQNNTQCVLVQEVFLPSFWSIL